ncbi:hypothetical protein, partial [Streptomyces pseudogriseolus]
TETLGCFQIESPGQRDLVGRLQPSTFHDLGEARGHERPVRSRG